MNQASPLARQYAPHHAAEFGKILPPDVLEHADRDEGIAMAADISVIVFNEFHPVRQPLLPCAAACECQLLPRDVEGAHLGAVTTRDVQRQTPPPATGLHHRVPGAKSKFAAHVIHLADLGLLESGLCIDEVRAGVGHRLAQP